MAKADASVLIVTLFMILIFLLVIIGMLTKCRNTVSKIFEETQIETTTTESLS
jgi:hypothetical protein